MWRSKYSTLGWEKNSQEDKRIEGHRPRIKLDVCCIGEETSDWSYLHHGWKVDLWSIIRYGRSWFGVLSHNDSPSHESEVMSDPKILCPGKRYWDWSFESRSLYRRGWKEGIYYFWDGYFPPRSKAEIICKREDWLASWNIGKKVKKSKRGRLIEGTSASAQQEDLEVNLPPPSSAYWRNEFQGASSGQGYPQEWTSQWEGSQEQV